MISHTDIVSPGSDDASTTDSLIRLVIQQPSLAKYRVPVFRELAQRQGIRLRIIHSARNGIPNVAADGFNATEIPMRQLRFLGQPIYWHSPQWTLADRHHADVLILTWDLHYASLIPALLRARANGIPTILWGHGYSKTDSLWRSGPRRWVAKLATALLFYNQTAADAYIRAGFDPQRIFVALNSLDQTPIQQARQDWLDRPEELARFRREQRLKTGPRLLFVSRLGPERRVDLLLEAMAQLAPDWPELQLILIGKGEHQSVLQQQADALGLGGRVRFVGAIYKEMALAPWFLSADCFVFPAFMGLSLQHAFGYGLPVITSDHLNGHGPEIEALRHGENGLLYADGDPKALAASIRQLLENPELRNKMAAEALRTATQEFTLTNMVDGFVSAAAYCMKQSSHHPM